MFIHIYIYECVFVMWKDSSEAEVEPVGLNLVNGIEL